MWLVFHLEGLVQPSWNTLLHFRPSHATSKDECSLFTGAALCSLYSDNLFKRNGTHVLHRSILLLPLNGLYSACQRKETQSHFHQIYTAETLV